MNYRPTAMKAAVVLALTLVPGALFAGSVQGAATAVDWDNSSSVLTGITSSWSMELLKHNAGTLHVFIGNPDVIPPGACRAIGHRWNIAVFQNRPDAWFRTKLIPRMAQFNCHFAYERADLPNADGEFDLKVIGPAQ